MSRFGRQQARHPVDKRRRCLAAGKTRPLYFAELVWYAGRGVGRAVNDDRQQERLVVRHVARPFYREPPLAAEVTLASFLRVRGDDGDEQNALADQLGDLPVPGVPAPKLALVELDLYADRPEGLADAPRRLGILRCVT